MRHPITGWLWCFLIAVSAVSSLATYQLSDEKESTQTARALAVKLRSVLKGHKRQVGALSFSPDGQILATSGDGDNAQLWDVATGQSLVNLPGHRTVDLAFSPDGRTLAIEDVNEVRLWDVPTGQLKPAPTRKKGFVSSVAFAPDSRMVATANFDELAVKLWDVETGRLEASLAHEKECRYCGESVGNVAFSSDGRTLATSGFRRAYLWDVATRKLRATLVDETGVLSGGISHGSTIYKIALSPDGRTLATGSRDATAKLWDVATGELRAILKGHKGGVHRLAFSPDGRTLATGSNDKTVRLWETSTGRLKATLQHRGTVWSIDFSADGKLVATGADNDHAVKLWDAKAGELLATLEQGRDPVAFSPDGRLLATAGEKNIVLLWDVPQK